MTSIGDGSSRVGASAPDIVGVGVDGTSITIEIAAESGRMLLAFLSTDCLGCASVWRALDDPGAHRPPDDVDAVVVLRGKEGDLSERATGTDHALIAVSDDAWRDYSVLGYPTVVIIDRPTATVVAQSTVLDWTGVAPLFDAGR